MLRSDPTLTLDLLRAGVSQLHLNAQSTMPLTGPAMYFVRCCAKPDMAVTKPETEICFGELHLGRDNRGELESNPMEDFDVQLSQACRLNCDAAMATLVSLCVAAIRFFCRP